MAIELALWSEIEGKRLAVARGQPQGAATFMGR